MGLVTTGIPRDIVVKLAVLAQANVFVETGTFRGDTARWAAEIFDSVHTIELSEQLYEAFHHDLDLIPNVHTHFGDSADVLPQLMSDLEGKRALHWLDGHWSCGETAGEDKECPLLEELESLIHRSQDLILVDDARLFLCAPPQPHDPSQWPTMTEIIGLFQGEHQRFVQVINDVIFIIPQEEILVNGLIEYAQSQAQSPKPKGLRHRLARTLLGVG